MRWLASTIAAVSLLGSVALPIALSKNSPGHDAISPANGRVCASTPDWFRPIHRYYDCNPRITPQFDFASLYAPPLASSAPPASSTRSSIRR
jgi:hypothetical protein